jgi:hypothetical protein
LLVIERVVDPFSRIGKSKHSESVPLRSIRGHGFGGQQIGDLRRKRIATDKAFVSLLLLAAVYLLISSPDIGLDSDLHSRGVFADLQVFPHPDWPDASSILIPSARRGIFASNTVAHH